jgi:hypothetical protein
VRARRRYLPSLAQLRQLQQRWRVDEILGDMQD